MNDGLYISPGALRLAAGVLSSALLAALVSQIPAMRRYVKAETM